MVQQIVRVQVRHRLLQPAGKIVVGGLARRIVALQQLRSVEREAIIARVELGYGYEELAVALGKPSPGAARVAVTRALARLARLMERDG